MKTMRTPGRPYARYQQGAALLILLTIVMLAASYALLERLNQERPDILRAGDTAAVLAEAKTALIAYALLSTNRPGQLPCPDYGTGAAGIDGISDNCDENPRHVSIGRLPWRTLGLADLRDASGESLWYAPDLQFDGSFPINSNTQTSLTVVTLPSEQFAAVIIAPGKVTSSQSRPQTLTAQMTAGRYLEASNASADENISVLSPDSSTEFTDQVLLINRGELMPPVERLVLKQMRVFLNGLVNLPSPTNNYPNDCNAALVQGFLPGNCPTGTPINWPAWFVNNNWQDTIWYVMDPAAGLILRDSGNTVTAMALLIAVGPTLAGQDRSSLPPTLNNLLELANADGNPLDFENVTIGPSSNDQVLKIQ